MPLKPKLADSSRTAGSNFVRKKNSKSQWKYETKKCLSPKKTKIYYLLTVLYPDLDCSYIIFKKGKEKRNHN